MHHNLNKATTFDLDKMRTINLLREREAEQSETRRQIFFDFEGIDFETAYAKLACEEKKRILEEEHGYDFDELNPDTNIDSGFQNIWRRMIERHDAFAQISQLKEKIRIAEEQWQEQLHTPAPSYTEYIRNTKGGFSWAFLKLADEGIVQRLNRVINKYNSLTPEERAEKWFQYVAKTRVILYNTTPRFVAERGCINCCVSKHMEETHGQPYGFDHEIISGCFISGCQSYGRSLTSPFIDPEEVFRKAVELGEPEGIKNARRYIADIKEKYGSCYEEMDINLDSMIEELDANISPEE